MKATKKKEKTMATILDGKLTSAKVKEDRCGLRGWKDAALSGGGNRR